MSRFLQTVMTLFQQKNSEERKQGINFIKLIAQGAFVSILDSWVTKDYDFGEQRLNKSKTTFVELLKLIKKNNGFLDQEKEQNKESFTEKIYTQNNVLNQRQHDFLEECFSEVDTGIKNNISIFRKYPYRFLAGGVMVGIVVAVFAAIRLKKVSIPQFFKK